MKTLAAAALALCLAAPAAAQERGAFIVRLGRDTVAVEQFTRTADRIEGTMVTRTPRTAVRTYTATLRPDGTISRLEMTTRIPSAPDVLPQTITVATGGDSADVRIVRGDTVRDLRVGAPAEAFPFLSNSYALAEPLMRWAAARNADSVAVPIVQPGARTSGVMSVIRNGADSVNLRSANGVTRVRVDAQGRVMGARSPESTFKAEVDRVAALDVQAVAADFARRDQSGQAMGTLSPRDSVVASIDGANLSVAFGRPSLRGRELSALAPAGQVWRTGANDATAFRTDRDLVFGDTRVPAGSYTLWTIPGADGWTLIVNRRTGQWGTEYDPAQDLARIPVRARRYPGDTVEQFRIALQPAGCGDGGEMVLSWGDVRVTAPFTVAR
jgi:hypothetical protein